MSTLYLAPKISYQLIGLLLFLHVLAACALFCSQFKLFMQILLIVILCSSFVYCVYQNFYAKKITACWYRGESWYIEFLNQTIAEVNLLPHSYINTIFSILQFQHIDTMKKYTLLLPYDALSQENRRELFCLLKVL